MDQKYMRVKLFKMMIKLILENKRRGGPTWTCIELENYCSDIYYEYRHWLLGSEYFLKIDHYGNIYVNISSKDHYGKITMFKEFLKQYDGEIIL